MLYLKYFCISLVFFLHFNEFTLAFSPTNTVWGHNSVLADSKIYFTGGIFPKSLQSYIGTPSKEFYYLDVKNSFKVGEGSLPWTDLSSVSQLLPTHAWSALSLCGPDNDTLVMFGGDFGSAKVNPERLVYTYEIKSQQLKNPTTKYQPKNKHSRSVCDMKTGKMYMFSGSGEFAFNNMDILNTRTLDWISPPVGSPDRRYDYTATLLSNGIIVYIGGVLELSNVLDDMSKLHLYNINNDTWSMKNAFGYLPTPRGFHSAVLTKDGRIIVYGGYTSHDTLIPVTDDLVVLDTTQPNFTWSKASVSTISPPPRSYHSATLVGDYMIVAFGNNAINFPSSEANEIFILDTSDKSDYRWVDEFIPTGSSSDEKTKNQSIIRGLIIGMIVLAAVVLILVVGLIYLYRKRKQSRPRLPVELT